MGIRCFSCGVLLVRPGLCEKCRSEEITRMERRQAAARMVKCPSCLVSQGERCMTSSGTTRSLAHKSRETLAAQRREVV
jgi:hypothetical protein